MTPTPTPNPAPAPQPDPPKTILGLGQHDFDYAYYRSRDPRIRALASITDESARMAAAAKLAQAGLAIDVEIDASWEYGDPFETTLLRMEYGVQNILNWSGDPQGDPGSIVMPVPPDLTPFPDPVVKQNQFVGPLLRPANPATGSAAVYTALPRGWQCAPGVIVVEKDGDGGTYERVSQQQPGDPIALFIAVPAGTVSTNPPPQIIV